MPKNYCIMQIWAESGKSALPICNYSQILYQFLTFTQNLKRSRPSRLRHTLFQIMTTILQTGGKEDDAVSSFLFKKKAENKPYLVYMTAGANKFLRVYYGKVKECLRNQEQAEE